MAENAIPSGSLNFSGVKGVADKRMTRPGTIGVFTIKEVTFGETDNKKTPYMKLAFDRADDSFSHSFFTRGSDESKTRKVLGRIQSLMLAATGTELDADVSLQQLALKLTGRQIALKVIGRIDEKNDKAYPELPYGGFCKPADEEQFLSFSAEEKALVDDCLEIMNRNSSGNADSEGSGSGDSTGTGEGGTKRRF